MSELKYKVGDKVRIKDIGWYNENKNEDGDVELSTTVFLPEMSKYCGTIVTIKDIFYDINDIVLYQMEGGIIWGWTDEMIECLVERNGKTYPYKIGDRVVLKGNNRCATITDLKYNSWGNLSYYVKIDNDKDISIDYPTDLLLPYDNKVEGLVEKETPKFKINDIVFVKNIGWVRITNSYWDSLANEYIYEAIGFNGEGEYDSINQSNIECLMLPEPENPHIDGIKITLDEYENNDKEWLFNKLAMLDNITALESIQDIFNHLQQSKYPKSYEECCEILNYKPDFYDADETLVYGYMADELRIFQKLLVCRNAYWKLYGDEMGLGKPWEPDWHDSEKKYTIECYDGEIIRDFSLHQYRTFSFPTPEMRDTFKENFKSDIEQCKELL